MTEILAPEKRTITLNGRQHTLAKLTLKQLCQLGRLASKLKGELAGTIGPQTADWDAAATIISKAQETGMLKEFLEILLGTTFGQDEAENLPAEDMAALAAAVAQMNDFGSIWANFQTALEGMATRSQTPSRK